MGGEAAELTQEPEQATPADELEIATASSDPAVIPGKNYPLVIRSGNEPGAKLLVAIDDQGVLTYGEDYDPDAAAVVFWDALARNMPDFRTQPQD